MGWTHNWQRGNELPKDRFATAVKDCKTILDTIGVPLAGFGGEGQPIFTDEAVVFNGVGGSGCEPFEIHQTEFDRRGRKVFWTSCKTERAPYDICVQASLIVLKHHLGDAIAVGSDGTDADWEQARRVCQTQLGYGADFRLTRA